MDTNTARRLAKGEGNHQPLVSSRVRTSRITRVPMIRRHVATKAENLQHEGTDHQGPAVHESIHQEGRARQISRVSNQGDHQ